MIFWLTVLFIFLLAATLKYWTDRYQRRAWRVIGKKRTEESTNKRTLAGIRMIISEKKQSVSSVIAAILGSVFCLFVLHSSPVFGLVIGGIIPYAAVTWWRSYKLRAYREDGLVSLELAKAIVGSGGTLQEWVIEAKDRLDGPLKLTFLQAASHLRTNIAIENFLETLVKSSEDRLLQWAFAGLPMNYRSAGKDLPRYINEIMNEIQMHLRFERILKQEQKNTNALLVFIVGFPIFLYLLFRHSVDHILKQFWYTNLILLVALIGYVAIFIAAARMAKPKF